MSKDKSRKTTIILIVLIQIILLVVLFAVMVDSAKIAEERNTLTKENKQITQQLEMEEKQHDRELGRMQAYIDTLKGGKWLYMGKFTTTGYCKCPKCCGKWSDCPTFTGTTPTAGRTIAVDPSVIPLGSTVLINGIEYVAEDTGSAIKGNKIDIYFQTHQQAVEYAKKYGKDVFIKIK